MPNPLRTLESVAIVDQTEPDVDWSRCEFRGHPGAGDITLFKSHQMISFKTNSIIGFVEQCERCGWIDAASLNWWAEDFLKQEISKRAQRIAVAIESQPFAFVQPPSGELSVAEVCAQALAAAATLTDEEGNFDRQRAVSILGRLSDEVERFQRLAVEKAQEAK